MVNILLLEDDATLSRGICLALQGGSTALHPCRTLAGARDALRAQGFDMLILDLNLPDGSGLDLLREVRKNSALPVLILTANDLELDIVTGLESGADDYLTKPFSLAVLRARVAALLRRARPGGAAYRCGGLAFDFAAMKFSKNGREIELSRTEQKLLQLLVANKGQTLPRATLLDRVWGTAAYVDENALSVTVKRLRDKIEDVPKAPQHICTVYGIGYVWREQP